jgi:hypothetical protein
MTNFSELDTKVYTDFAAVEADADCDFDVWHAAATAYWAAEAEGKAAWDAIPEGDAKNSAMFNANDMQVDGEFSAANRLAWYVAALATFEFNRTM